MKKLFILFCSAAILFGCAEKKEEKKDGAATTETKDGDAKKDDAKTAPGNARLDHHVEKHDGLCHTRRHAENDGFVER